MDEITDFEYLRGCSLDDLHYALRSRISAALKCAFIISSPKHNDPLGCFEYKQIRKQLEKVVKTSKDEITMTRIQKEIKEIQRQNRIIWCFDLIMLIELIIAVIVIF